AGHAVVGVDHGPPELGKGTGTVIGLPTLRTAPIHVPECAVRCAAFSFATVEHDPHVAPIRELPAQLVVSVQSRACDDENEHGTSDGLATTDPTTAGRIARVTSS